jgi:hypothetical protein
LENIAVAYGVHGNTVRRWAATGKIAVVRAPSGRIIGVPESELAAAMRPKKSKREKVSRKAVDIASHPDAVRRLRRMGAME